MEDLEVLREIGRGGFATYVLTIACDVRHDSEEMTLPMLCGVLGLIASSCVEKSQQTASLHAALKRIPLERIRRSEQQRRVEAERYLLEHVRSPFLSRGIRSFRDDAFESLVLEYIEEARPLYQCIWRYKETNVFPEHVAKYFAVQIVLAVEEIHAMGFLHRDLKSGNVLVDKHGVARVIDFGFAMKLNSDRSQEKGLSICGTHYIMAPEMYLGQHYGIEVDWWAVGVIVHEMVCGQPPWDYKPGEGMPVAKFLDQISSVAKGFSQGHASSPLLESSVVSEQCKSFVKALLQYNPTKRLGHAGGGLQVKSHPWFLDIDWDAATNFGKPSPYNPTNDFRIQTSGLHTPRSISSSSAESIDPEDDAKYFGDF